MYLDMKKMMVFWKCQDLTDNYKNYENSEDTGFGGGYDDDGDDDDDLMIMMMMTQLTMSPRTKI
jgi:hypothetical protein